MEPTSKEIRATFPIEDERVEVLFHSGSSAESAAAEGLSLLSGRRAQVIDRRSTTSVMLAVDLPSDDALISLVDQVVIGEHVGPPFIHGIRSPMELKVPHMDASFPFASSLDGVHVSVACCTGCNGGIHDRGLVVLNNHTGGSWSGIWVQSDLDMPDDYARWQKVAFFGGVVRNRSGSITVCDEGWMQVGLAGEIPHEAPRPASVRAVDFPISGTTSLLSASLDGAYVEFTDIRVRGTRAIEPGSDSVEGHHQLRGMELVFVDQSEEVESVAYLFQKSALGIMSGTGLESLRGFIHAEGAGRYVLLGDKEEDIRFA